MHNRVVAAVRWPRRPTARQVRERWAAGYRSPRVYRATVPLGELTVAPRGRSVPDLAPPPIVVARRSGGGWHVMDGHHRVAGWRRRGVTHAPAWVLDYTALPRYR